MILVSGNHCSASFGTTSARDSTTLAVLHVMRVTLFRTPVADVCAELAYLLGERTVARDRISAQPADRCALDAAGRAVIFALDADHVRETNAALGCAEIAGVHTSFAEFVWLVIHTFSFN